VGSGADEVCRLNWFASETMAEFFYMELLAQKYSKLSGMFYFYKYSAVSVNITGPWLKYYQTMALDSNYNIAQQNLTFFFLSHELQ
jgi:hypothetical protein